MSKKDKQTTQMNGAPGVLEAAAWRKSSQDYGLTVAVDHINRKYVKPLMDDINRHCVVFFIPVSSKNEAEALLKSRSDEIPQIPAAENTLTGECDVHELADLLVMTPRNVQLLDKKGTLVKIGRGRYDPVRSTQNYIRDLREQARGGGDAALVEERKGLVRAQRERAEIDLAVRKEELVMAADVKQVIERTFGSIKNKLLFLPPKAAGLLKVCKTRIQREEVLDRLVRECLDELSGVPAGKAGGGGGVKNAKAAPKTKRKQVGGRKKASQPRKQRGAR